MTHATLYVNGQGAFNEGLAVLVGKVGALKFFEKTYGPEHPFTDEARDALAVLEKENGSIRKAILFLEQFCQKEGDLIVRLRSVLNDPRP
jgi:hypothetical protein